MLRFDGDLTGTLLIIKQRGLAELGFGVINHTASKCRVCSFGIYRNIITKIEGLEGGESDEGWALAFHRSDMCLWLLITFAFYIANCHYSYQLQCN